MSINPGVEHKLADIRNHKRLRAFFHPDKLSVGKSALGGRDLPATDYFWNELYDLDIIMKVPGGYADRILQWMAPGHWTSASAGTNRRQ
jgi:hypothetical protein